MMEATKTAARGLLSSLSAIDSEVTPERVGAAVAALSGAEVGGESLRVYSVADVVRLSGRSKRTVMEWARSGRLVRVAGAGRRAVGFSGASVRALLEGRTA